LLENGYLILGNFETMETSFIDKYERVKYSGEFVYRKITQSSQIHAQMVKRKNKINGGPNLNSVKGASCD